MLLDRYPVQASPDFREFSFTSVGPKGAVPKVVKYEEINVRGFFNLGFGDADLDTGRISDITVTNNRDSQKVLATVASTLDAFMNAHPDAVVIAAGSTEARTRLYQMGIAANLEDIQRQLDVFGETEDGWQPFQR